LALLPAPAGCGNGDLFLSRGNEPLVFMRFWTIGDDVMLDVFEVLCVGAMELFLSAYSVQIEFLMTGMMLGLLLEILKLQVLKSLSIALQGIAHQLQLLLQAGIVWFLLQHGTQSEK